MYNTKSFQETHYSESAVPTQANKLPQVPPPLLQFLEHHDAPCNFIWSAVKLNRSFEPKMSTYLKNNQDLITQIDARHLDYIIDQNFDFHEK